MDLSYQYLYDVSNATLTYCDSENFGIFSSSIAINCYCQQQENTWSKHISMASDSPYKLTALRNDSEGYSHNICVACQNVAEQWVTTGIWNITQIACAAEQVSLVD